MDRQTADLIAIVLMLGGVSVAFLIALRYGWRRMTRQDWADAFSWSGIGRMRFFRQHGIRLLLLLAGLFLYFFLVGQGVLPLIERMVGSGATG